MNVADTRLRNSVNNPDWRFVMINYVMLCERRHPSLSMAFLEDMLKALTFPEMISAEAFNLRNRYISCVSIRFRCDEIS